MGMVRAIRMLNAATSGNLTGPQIETLLTTGDRLGEWEQLLSLRGQAGILAASSTAMTAVAASSTAMTAVAASSTAMTAVAASSTAMTAVAASGSAQLAIRASSTAMDALRAAASVAQSADNDNMLYEDMGAASSGTVFVTDVWWETGMSESGYTELQSLSPEGGMFNAGTDIGNIEAPTPVGRAFTNLQVRLNGGTSNHRIRYVRYIPIGGA